MPQPDHPPIDQLADYYPPRPGYCNSTNVPHPASKTYVLQDRGYFDGHKRICHIHLLMKMNIAVWPRNWLWHEEPKFDGARPTPKELREWPHNEPKATPDNSP